MSYLQGFYFVLSKKTLAFITFFCYTTPRPCHSHYAMAIQKPRGNTHC